MESGNHRLTDKKPRIPAFVMHLDFVHCALSGLGFGHSGFCLCSV